MSPWASLRRLLTPAAPAAAGAAERPATALSDAILPPVEPAAPAAVPPPSAPAEPSAGVPAMPPADAPASTVADRLRAEMARAVARFEAEAPRSHRTPDVMSLIGQIAGDPSGRLRQPPAAARRAMTACNNPDVPANALVALLEQDPMLAQAVLARANSAYYHRGGPPCLALADAINRQGRRSVHNVLLQQAVEGLIFHPGGIWNEMVGKVWSHMVRTGPIARAVAPVFGIDPEQAFALALLHDVGKLSVFDRVASMRTARRADPDLPKPAVVLALRLLHEPLGGLCALGWGFGDDAAAAIARHHRDPAPVEGDAASEVIWVAERVDLAAQRGDEIDVKALWHAGNLSADPAALQRALDDVAPVPV